MCETINKLSGNNTGSHADILKLAPPKKFRTFGYKRVWSDAFS